MTCVRYIAFILFVTNHHLQIHFVRAGSTEKMAEAIDVMCFSLRSRVDI